LVFDAGSNVFEPAVLQRAHVLGNELRHGEEAHVVFVFGRETGVGAIVADFVLGIQGPPPPAPRFVGPGSPENIFLVALAGLQFVPHGGRRRPVCFLVQKSVRSLGRFAARFPHRVDRFGGIARIFKVPRFFGC